MQTIVIKKTYKLKWQFINDHNYKLSECGVLINTKTNREIKKVINGRTSIGYWIGRKFYSLKMIKKNPIFELIQKL